MAVGVSDYAVRCAYRKTNLSSTGGLTKCSAMNGRVCVKPNGISATDNGISKKIYINTPKGYHDRCEFFFFELLGMSEFMNLLLTSEAIRKWGIVWPEINQRKNDITYECPQQRRLVDLKLNSIHHAHLVLARSRRKCWSSIGFWPHSQDPLFNG